MKSIIFMTTALLLQASIASPVITPTHLSRAQSSESRATLAKWGAIHIKRFNNLFDKDTLRNNGMSQIEDKKDGFLRWSSKNSTSVNDILGALRIIHRDKSSDIDESREMAQALGPFLSPKKNHLGLSQAVLDTALACVFFRDDSSDYQRRHKVGYCRTYPKLAAATLKLIWEVTPKRGNTLSSWSKWVTRSNIDFHRGAVISRALVPIYNALKLTAPEVKFSNWPSEYKQGYRAGLTAFLTEISESLRDFYVRLGMGKRDFKGQSSGQRFYQLRTKYRHEYAMEYCQKSFPKISSHQARTETRWNRRKCTSNHAMSMHLGRLMVTDLMGSYIDWKLRREYSEMVKRSIYNEGSIFYMSDQFRTHDKESGGSRNSKASGIGYSFLQASILVTAAEILQGTRLERPYGVDSYRLLRVIEGLSKITNRKTAHSDYFFSNINSSKAKYGFYMNSSSEESGELSKYVYKTSGKNLNWARNYGFFLIVKSRFCYNQNFRSQLSNLCMTLYSDSYDSNVHFSNSITKKIYWGTNYGDAIEGMETGPTQLLFIRNRRE